MKLSIISAVVAVSSVFDFASAGNWSSDISSATSATESLSNAVSSWTPSSGYAGLSQVQGLFPNFHGAINALASDIPQLQQSQIQAEDLEAFLSSLNTLVSGVITQVPSFDSVGGGAVIFTDLLSLPGPFTIIITGLFKFLHDDCVLFNDVEAIVDDVYNGVTELVGLFGIDLPALPVIDCPL